MRKVKTFESFIVEGIRDKMTPKSPEQIKKSISSGSRIFGGIDKIYQNNLSDMFTKEELVKEFFKSGSKWTLEHYFDNIPGGGREMLRNYLEEHEITKSKVYGSRYEILSSLTRSELFKLYTLLEGIEDNDIRSVIDKMRFSEKWETISEFELEYLYPKSEVNSVLKKRLTLDKLMKSLYNRDDWNNDDGGIVPPYVKGIISELTLPFLWEHKDDIININFKFNGSLWDIKFNVGGKKANIMCGEIFDPTKEKNINEGIRDKMTPKSEDEIKKSLEHITDPKEMMILGIEYGQPWLVKRAIDSGVQVGGYVKIYDSYKRVCHSYLEYATSVGNAEIVKILMDNGAEGWGKDMDAAIDIAATEGNMEILNILNPHKNWNNIFNNRMKFNESVKDLMIPKSREEIKSGLNELSLEDKLDRKNKYEDLYKRYKPFLRKLYSEETLRKDAEKVSPDKKVELGYKHDIPWLLEDGIKEGGNIVTNGRNILRKACFNGHEKVVKLLLKKGVSANTPHALTSAVERGHIKIVKMLLDRGADPHQEDNYAFTCSACSYAQNSKEIHELLKKYA